jgi:Chitin synthase
MVVVKVGKPTERTKPGNRGKRDSQILLLHYLNRVHFDAPMSPLELEIYHQMRNVIGIDPAFYEYIFTVDADTVSCFVYLGKMFLVEFLCQDGHSRITEPDGCFGSR